MTACGPIDQSGDIKLKMDWSVPTRNIVDREIGEYFSSLILFRKIFSLQSFPGMIPPQRKLRIKSGRNLVVLCSLIQMTRPGTSPVFLVIYSTSVQGCP